MAEFILPDGQSSEFTSALTAWAGAGGPAESKTELRPESRGLSGAPSLGSGPDRYIYSTELWSMTTLVLGFYLLCTELYALVETLVNTFNHRRQIRRRAQYVAEILQKALAAAETPTDSDMEDMEEDPLQIRH